MATVHNITPMYMPTIIAPIKKITYNYYILTKPVVSQHSSIRNHYNTILSSSPKIHGLWFVENCCVCEGNIIITDVADVS